ncbi:MAG: hypothetical protein JF588_11530 [Caulobacterales bacterium]|nr:hypothetical protein [Caulobacterales bacterium]
MLGALIAAAALALTPCCPAARLAPGVDLFASIATTGAGSATAGPGAGGGGSPGTLDFSDANNSGLLVLLF